MKVFRQPCALDEGIIELHLEGVAGAGDAASLNKAIVEIDAFPTTNVFCVVDKLKGLSTSALGALEKLRERLVRMGGEMFVVGAREGVRDKWTREAAGGAITTYPDVRAAHRAYLRKHGSQEIVLSLTFPPKLQAVPIVRHLIADVSLKKGCSVKDAFRMEAIVDEIANNAVEHGDPRQGSVFLEFKLANDTMELKVRNKSYPEKIEQLRKAVRAAGKRGAFQVGHGRGIPLVKLLSHSLQVSFDNRGTLVRVSRLKAQER